jgi:hypothetical protein
MKRSEAIKLIVENVETYRNLHDLESYEVAYRILDALEEEAGMNPPYDPTSDDEDPNYCWEPE